MNMLLVIFLVFAVAAQVECYPSQNFKSTGIALPSLMPGESTTYTKLTIPSKNGNSAFGDSGHLVIPTNAVEVTELNGSVATPAVVGTITAVDKTVPQQTQADVTAQTLAAGKQTFAQNQVIGQAYPGKMFPEKPNQLPPMPPNLIRGLLAYIAQIAQQNRPGNKVEKRLFFN